MTETGKQVGKSTPKKGHKKRKEVQADDGWTVITHKTAQPSRNQKNNVSKQLKRALPVKVMEGLTGAKLSQDFVLMRDKWRLTECATFMKQFITSKRWDIKTAVCIGIGSFSLDWEHRYRSLWQLALFVDVLDWAMENDERSEVIIYAQDPIFSAVDIDFLSSLRRPVIVVEDGIQKHISSRTFIFSPFVDWALLLPTFIKDRDPVLYIGNAILSSYEDYAGGQKCGDECGAIGKIFLDGREMTKVPDFSGHDAALQGLNIYCKEDDHADVVGG